jgi:iron(III) transport system ATP-binding protein
MQRRLGFAAIYVTHDQEEALGLADRLAVLNDGKLVQFDEPREVYINPATRYVANFVGAVNELEGTVVAVEPGHRIIVETPLGPVRGDWRTEGLPTVGDQVVAIVRPHRVKVTADEPTAGQKWPAHVVSSMFVGHRLEHVVRVRDLVWRVWADENGDAGASGDVWVSFSPEDARVLAA